MTNGWLGGGQAWMLIALDEVRVGLTIPESAFALFQLTFAAITPALMVGAWVDRARFALGRRRSARCGACWSTRRSRTGSGAAAGWRQRGALDFAGGIVVHTTAGVSALVIALLLGKRQGFPGAALLPHAPGLTMLGAMLLWVGWFGFNGGSALAAGDGAGDRDPQHPRRRLHRGAGLAADRAVHLRQADHGRLRHRRDRRARHDHARRRVHLAGRGDRVRRDAPRWSAIPRSS